MNFWTKKLKYFCTYAALTLTMICQNVTAEPSPSVPSDGMRLPQDSWRQQLDARTNGMAIGVGLHWVYGLGRVQITRSLNDVITNNAMGDFHTSTPMLEGYGRWYSDAWLCLPSYFSVEGGYYFDFRKRSMFENFFGSPDFDEGFDWCECGFARAVFGFQVAQWERWDLWARLGGQGTKFNITGRALEQQIGGTTVRNRYDGSDITFGPVGGAELRWAMPQLYPNNVRTDLIFSWNSSYMPAIDWQGSSFGGAQYNYKLNARWQHEFGVRLQFAF
jgi:hypothetical protein